MGNQISRRKVLVSLPVMAVGAGALLSIGCGGAAIPRTTVTYGRLEDLPAGAPQRLASYDVYLLRTDQGVAAISGRCTHAGCGVTAVEGGAFHCGCHGSEFAADGTVTHGPAGSDLPWFAVRIEDGNVVVDPSQTVPKGTFTPTTSGGESVAK